jgi:hypothetical protein
MFIPRHRDRRGFADDYIWHFAQVHAIQGKTFCDRQSIAGRAAE